MRRGDVLFTLYSPELYAAQQEYLQALAPGRARSRRARARRLPGARGAQAAAALGHGDRRHRRASRGAATPLEALPIRSPASGYVVEKNVVAGAAVEPGARLLRIAPLDRVWVEAEVYESDLPLVAVGQRARRHAAVPARTRASRRSVAYVYPRSRRETRTARVPHRARRTRDLALRPDMYATSQLRVDLGERAARARVGGALRRQRRFVFVDLGEGRLAPRTVDDRRASDGRASRSSTGLEPGERVVAPGTS